MRFDPLPGERLGPTNLVVEISPVIAHEGPCARPSFDQPRLLKLGQGLTDGAAADLIGLG